MGDVRLWSEMEKTFAETMKGTTALVHVLITEQKNKARKPLRKLLKLIRNECKGIGRANNIFTIQSRASSPLRDLKKYVMVISEKKDRLQDYVESFKNELESSGSSANSKEDLEVKLNSVINGVDAFGDAVDGLLELIISSTRPSSTTIARFKTTFFTLRAAINALPSFGMESIEDVILAEMKALNVGI